MVYSSISPEFQSRAIIGDSDIYLDTKPVVHANSYSKFSEFTSNSSTIDPQKSNTVCHHMVQVQPKIATSEHDVDNILSSLRRYYSEIKTKRQLSLDLQAGF